MFLFISQGLSLTRAAEKAGYTPVSVLNWKKRDEAFAEGIATARLAGTNALIDEARRRGYAGVNKPVFHKGKICGHIREYSDTLLMFLIKQRDPSFRENFTLNGQIEHRHTHEHVLRSANERAMAALAQARALPAPTVENGQ